LRSVKFCDMRFQQLQEYSSISSLLYDILKCPAQTKPSSFLITAKPCDKHETLLIYWRGQRNSVYSFFEKILWKFCIYFTHTVWQNVSETYQQTSELCSSSLRP